MPIPSPPDEFYNFTNMILSVWRELGPTPDASIDLALSQTKPPQRKIVSAYFTRLLDGGYTDKQLHDLWWASGAGFGADIGGTRYLMRVVRDRLDGLDVKL